MVDIRHKGSSAYFGVALEGETKVNLAGAARGLDSISINEVEDQRDIPGGGVYQARQPIGYKQGSSSFTVDENDLSRFLHGKIGKRLELEYGPEGNTTGKPKWNWEAIIASHTHSVENRGVRRISIDLNHDGLIAESTYA